MTLHNPSSILHHARSCTAAGTSLPNQTGGDLSQMLNGHHGKKINNKTRIATNSDHACSQKALFAVGSDAVIDAFSRDASLYVLTCLLLVMMTSWIAETAQKDAPLGMHKNQG